MSTNNNNRKLRRIEQKRLAKQRKVSVSPEALIGRLKSLEKTFQDRLKNMWNSFYLIDVHIWVLNKICQDLAAGTVQYSKNYLEWRTNGIPTEKLPFTESPIDYQYYYVLGQKWKEEELVKAAKAAQEPANGLKEPFDVDKELEKAKAPEEGEIVGVVKTLPEEERDKEEVPPIF